jgi:hypothetical protein
MMNNNVHCLTERLAQMEVLHSAPVAYETSCETAWRIANFRQLMNNYVKDLALEPSRQITIHFAEGQGSASMALECCPRWHPLSPQVGVLVRAKISCFSPLGNLAMKVSIGLLDIFGAEHIWKTSENTTDIHHGATLSHDKLLAEAGSLLPDGQLTILVKESSGT